jgi:hypothetical protein
MGFFLSIRSRVWRGKKSRSPGSSLTDPGVLSSSSGVDTLIPVFSTRFKVALASLGVLCGVLVAAFSPVVRYKAAQAARQYGAELAIEDVAPRPNGVRLRGVDVTFADVPSIRVHLAEVEVAYGAGGRRLVLRDGVVAAVGPPRPRPGPARRRPGTSSI